MKKKKNPFRIHFSQSHFDEEDTGKPETVQ